MRLTELTKDLFTYLVVFRRNVKAKKTIRIDEVGNDLRNLFERMDKNAERDAAVAPAYDRIRKLLVVIADGIVVGSDWDCALDYRMSHLLENSFYQTNSGGEYFFNEMAKLAPDAHDEREIFFTALALGFQGRLARDPEQRMDEKKKLYRGLPEKLVDQERVTAQAYEHTDERDCSVAPVARFGRYAIILAGMLVFFLILGRTMYTLKTNAIAQMVESLDVPKDESEQR